MRIDKLLCEMNIGTRSQVKDLIKKGQVLVNGQLIHKPEEKVDEKTAAISCKGKKYSYQPLVYYMLNKPAGVITATTDTKEKTVLDLFKQQYQELHDGDLTGIPLKDIFPVGRLDKDTVGLLLLTNDGELAHKLLSPVSHVSKIYYVETDAPLSEAGCLALKKGVEIGAAERTRPAEVEILDEKKYLLTITEGKFHQVKRMFEAVGLTVVYLKRTAMGSLCLDEKLPEGHIRELKQEEVSALCLKI